MSGKPVRRPCIRCGVPVQPNWQAKVPGVCKDCRAADPTYVRAILTGVPCVPART